MAEMESHWELNKHVLLSRAFPASNFDTEAAKQAAYQLCDRLESETGIKFTNEDASRFGNLEIFRHLSGDFRKSDGLCCRSIRTGPVGTERHSLLVWLEPPMDDVPNLMVGCRLFNGGGLAGRTCILNEIRPYKKGENLDFVPQEPFSQFEVSVWSDHRLIGYKTFAIVREISFNMHVNGGANRVKTRWSESLPSELRERAEKIPSGISQHSKIGSGQQDPWRATEQSSLKTSLMGTPKNTHGRYFDVSHESQIESVEYLSDLIFRPGVNRVVIVDPFFDSIGVQSLLVKLRETKEVVILTSHTASTGGKANLCAECERLREDLPRNVTVINIETPGEASQQFHDRYVLIEMDENRDAEPHIWMLSNSFSSMAKNYPLVIVMLPTDVAINVARYIRDLEQGKPPGKTHATRTLVWTKTSSPANPPQVAQVSADFEGSEKLLNLLISDQKLLRDWSVPPESLQTVVGAVKRAFIAEPSRRTEFMCIIARWCYYGGPQASAYTFDAIELKWLAHAFRVMLAAEAGQSGRMEVDLLQNNTELPEALETVWYWVNQMPFEARRNINPALYFFAEALWEYSPHDLVSILDETRNSSLFFWLCMEGGGAGEVQSQHLLTAASGAVKALGVVFLRECCQREAHTNRSNGIELLKTKLLASSLQKNEAWLSLVFVEARVSNRRESEASPFEKSAEIWPVEQLSEDQLNRITLLIDQAGPNRAIELVSFLAEACPCPNDKKMLHQWCVDQIVSLLPFKNPRSTEQEIRVWCNAETILAAARSVWKIHGDNSGEWLREEILKKLKLWNVLEPLLRTRDYSKWRDAVDSIVLALWFARAISLQGPTLQRRAESAVAMAPRIAQILAVLGPEIWRTYVHKHDQLWCVVAFVGWAAEYCNEEGTSMIGSLVMSDEVPGLWKLWLLVQSPKLLLKHSAIAEAVSKQPGAGEVRGYGDALENWCDRIADALTYLETEISLTALRYPRIAGPVRSFHIKQKFNEQTKASRLRGIFHVVRHNLRQWQSKYANSHPL